MSVNGALKTLNDVCYFENGDRGKNYPSKQHYIPEGIPFITAANVSEGQILDDLNYISQKRFNLLSRGKFRKGDFLFCLRGSLGKFGYVKSELIGGIASSMVIVRALEISDKWLYYYFLSDDCRREIDNYKGGAAQPNLGAQDLKMFKIFCPPLSEQHRIVAILDLAFAAMDKAKANLERNIENAKELFESYLQGVFERKGDGWEERILEECFKMKSGDNLTAKNMTEGDYAVFGGNGIAGYHNEYNLSGSNVIIGRVGALCGNVRYITENIWLTDNAFKVVDFKFDFDHSFLTYLLNHKDLRSYARQAAQPVISNSSLKDVVLYFPKSITEQQIIVRELDTLRTGTQKLASQYQKKLDNLDELKKAILEKAFKGELTTK